MWGKDQSSFPITHGNLGLPGVKNAPANAGDARNVGLSPGSGGSPGVGNAAHSGILAWKSHGQRSLVGYSPRGAKSWTRLSDWVAAAYLHIQLSQRYWCKKKLVSPLNCFSTFVENQMTINVKSLFLGCLLCSIDLYIYPCANTTLYSLLQLQSKFWNQIVEV